MKELFRAAYVIARRDYTASVFSKTFLFFLIGPLLPLLIGGMFGTMGANIDRKATHPTVAVIALADQADLLNRAHARLETRLGIGALPDLAIVAPAGDAGDAGAQTRALLADTHRNVVAVATGGLDAPLLTGPRGALEGIQYQIALVYDAARTERALALAGSGLPVPVALRLHAVDQAAGNDASARVLTARLGQLILMFLTMILAGMLLSNLIEEKSNKVIEVLAAAVPVDAIFLGKLIAMLCMSLTGILVWASCAVGAVAIFAPAAAGALPPPAVGWPAFVVLGVIYFIGCFLLLGSLFLGIGAQASTVREVQTLSMPVTMGQLGVVALASTVVGDPNSGVALFATIFPWSSPFAMLARAAQAGELWPHLIAILWQGLWVALIIRLSSRVFRASVLKSGRPRWLRLFRRKPAKQEVRAQSPAAV